ncbi:DUF3159 domain-containing protein [Nesterenkonia sp. E16_7]|uniref:DUF3159 domain-containing protein n=1 Tax=unclassified Nesterenkonia TaxID=2629769 RepID=UPI001A9398E8|nr:MULTISPECIES: DUF3159 domain-containing protein [unclassified Nesterenkonia]MBO0596033.1 DUF3159 domain-containing protein [Nesterenkonia sp. E16_10]MBO0599367.1 DUF3159 domain-containing protein [Nesterenkonia sp. E16_7]
MSADPAQPRPEQDPKQDPVQGSLQDPVQGPPADSGPHAAAQFSTAAGSRVRTGEDGSIDVLASVGGVRGLVESSLPAAAFLIAFLVTEDLMTALIISVAIGVGFAVLRLVQKGSLVQSLAGLAGILICALVAYRTGDARDFYAWGFLINAGYLLAFLVSILVKWPFLGLLFGIVRGEGLDWRRDPVRRRRYSLATWLLLAVPALRLIIQVPLYLADDVAGLGTARLVMGIPLYALALWVGWLISRPAQSPLELSPEKPAAEPDHDERG